MIAIKHLSQSFHQRQIPNNINLDIKRDEFFALIGTSGCGKRTLLNIIGGFEDFNDGILSINGRPFFRRANLINCIKIFQEYALLPWCNALGNVSFALLGKGFSAIQARQKA
ncbi:ATP-binding cassette domain-containing protein [uncultured Helicobacter sp.]|uniref:ATP-binding cassette domain-containing protein n=1 Tax=uncultured Helicobacter sp. TaxID=175537 RepID=UPI002610550E|nr:ATP-binding cassette domain-containing protein [uncultured Helicobacter sp.]